MVARCAQRLKKAGIEPSVRFWSPTRSTWLQPSSFYLLAVGGVQGFAFTLGVTTVIDIAVIFLFTHPMMELLIRTRFFGEGHKFSGLDPEHLGAKNALVYGGRGRLVAARRFVCSCGGRSRRWLVDR